MTSPVNMEEMSRASAGVKWWLSAAGNENHRSWSMVDTVPSKKLRWYRWTSWPRVAMAVAIS
jgi:hypothetical protein